MIRSGGKPRLKGKLMEPTLRMMCKRCREQMVVTAKIPPMEEASGLVVFSCLDCNRSEIALVEAKRWNAAVGRCHHDKEVDC